MATPLLGCAVGVAAFTFAHFSGHGIDQVLFSGEDSLAPLIQDAGTFTVGALVLLVACKGLAYSFSLSAFRGGPTLPAMFIGAVGGMAFSDLPWLPMIASVPLGIGAMTVTILRLPLTSVLLTGLFLQADGVTLMPLIIVAVVVAYVAAVRLMPPPTPAVPTGVPSPGSP